MRSMELSPDDVRPEDAEHDDVFMPVQRSNVDQRKYILLTDAWGEVLAQGAHKNGFIEAEVETAWSNAFLAALLDGEVTGGFLAHTGFRSCDGHELNDRGYQHARVGPFISDWYQSPDRMGVYVLNVSEFRRFLKTQPNARPRDIHVPASAPPAIRFLVEHGESIAKATTPNTQKAVARALEHAFRREHPGVSLPVKTFSAMAAMLKK